MVSKRDIDQSTFCVAPFTHQSTKTDGSIKLCCRSLPKIGSIDEMSLSEAWNSSIIREVRLEMISGRRNARCNICWNQEDHGIRSLRQKYNTDQERYDYALDVAANMDYDGETLDNPTWLEFKLSNLCNLKCRMCTPLDSTKWFQDYKLIRHLHDDNWNDYLSKSGADKKPLLDVFDDAFFEDIAPMLENIDYLQFAGGEPLYDDAHYKILEIVQPRAEHINLNYATNMTVLSTKNYNVLDFWEKHKRVVVAASIDGPPALNDYIRGSSQKYDIAHNVTRLKDYENISVTGKPTVQSLNIYYIPELFEWIKKNHFDSIDHHFVTWPHFLDCRIWTGNAREEITAKLESYTAAQTDPNIRHVVENILTFFTSSEQYTDEKWDKFIEYNRTLDEARNQSFEDYQFFKTYMKER